MTINIKPGTRCPTCGYGAHFGECGSHGLADEDWCEEGQTEKAACDHCTTVREQTTATLVDRLTKERNQVREALAKSEARAAAMREALRRVALWFKSRFVTDHDQRELEKQADTALASDAGAKVLDALRAAEMALTLGKDDTAPRHLGLGVYSVPTVTFEAICDALAAVRAVLK